jgi:alkanesulfonate monooxygenase SsuD/methylene tetrahydromethanopterin reductase-like flavin-dependent oxidoreductase (luciferase family)
MNMQHGVYSVPREAWLQSIREKAPIWANMEGILEAVLAAERRKSAGDTPEDEADLDFDDPVPVIALMNRQQAGQQLDPLEVFEALEPFDAVIIGDVDACRHKLERYAECGVDRLMCLMQMAPLPHETVMKSIRTAGKVLVPELAAFDRSGAPG